MRREEMRSLEELEDIKEQIYTEYTEKLERLYEQELDKVLAWFHERFPTRKLEWRSGMGTEFWMLDGELFDCDIRQPDFASTGQFSKHIVLKDRPWTRKEKLLSPLVNFYLSITDNTWGPTCGIGVPDKSVGEFFNNPKNW